MEVSEDKTPDLSAAQHDSALMEAIPRTEDVADEEQKHEAPVGMESVGVLSELPWPDLTRLELLKVHMFSRPKPKVKKVSSKDEHYGLAISESLRDPQPCDDRHTFMVRDPWGVCMNAPHRLHILACRS